MTVSFHSFSIWKSNLYSSILWVYSKRNDSIGAIFGLGQGSEIRANCPHVGSGLAKGVLSVTVLKILASFCASFEENHGKLQTSKSASGILDWTWHLLFANFEANLLGHWLSGFIFGVVMYLISDYFLKHKITFDFI